MTKEKSFYLYFVQHQSVLKNIELQKCNFPTQIFLLARSFE